MKRAIPVHRAEADRGSVVRAPCSPEERAFFAFMREVTGAGSMSDLIRFAVAHLAIEHDAGESLPETWRPHYEDLLNHPSWLEKLAEGVPRPPSASRAAEGADASCSNSAGAPGPLQK